MSNRVIGRLGWLGRLLVGALAVLAIALAAASCGGGGSSTSSEEGGSGGSTEAGSSGPSETESGAEESGAQISKAEKIIEENMAPVTEFTGPPGKIEAPTGKHILILNCAGNSIGCSSQTASAEEAAKALGWQTTVIDGEGNPTKFNEAIEQGISLHVDGMILASIDQRLIKNSLRKAKAAGIKVVSQWAGNIGPSAEYIEKPGATLGPDTVEGETPQPDLEIAEGQAAYVTAETGGDAHVFMLVTPEFPNETAKAEAFKADLAKLCPECEVVGEQKVNQAQSSTQVPSTVQAQLNSNPEINFIWVPYDDIGILADQGVRESGKTSEVSIISTVGIAPALKLICEGHSSMKATYAEAAIWPGYASADGLIHLFNGEKAATPELFEQYDTPSRLITQENCSSLSEEGNWNGDYDIPKAWEGRWGVG